MEDKVEPKTVVNNLLVEIDDTAKELIFSEDLMSGAEYRVIVKGGAKSVDVGGMIIVCNVPIDNGAKTIVVAECHLEPGDDKDAKNAVGMLSLNTAQVQEIALKLDGKTLPMKAILWSERGAGNLADGRVLVKLCKISHNEITGAAMLFEGPKGDSFDGVEVKGDINYGIERTIDMHFRIRDVAEEASDPLQNKHIRTSVVHLKRVDWQTLRISDEFGNSRDIILPSAQIDDVRNVNVNIIDGQDLGGVRVVSERIVDRLELDSLVKDVDVIKVGEDYIIVPTKEVILETSARNGAANTSGFLQQWRSNRQPKPLTGDKYLYTINGAPVLFSQYKTERVKYKVDVANTSFANIFRDDKNSFYYRVPREDVVWDENPIARELISSSDWRIDVAAGFVWDQSKLPESERLPDVEDGELIGYIPDDAVRIKTDRGTIYAKRFNMPALIGPAGEMGRIVAVNTIDNGEYTDPVNGKKGWRYSFSIVDIAGREVITPPIVAWSGEDGRDGSPGKDGEDGQDGRDPNNALISLVDETGDQIGDFTTDQGDDATITIPSSIKSFKLVKENDGEYQIRDLNGGGLGVWEKYAQSGIYQIVITCRFDGFDGVKVSLVSYDNGVALFRSDIAVSDGVLTWVEVNYNNGEWCVQRREEAVSGGVDPVEVEGRFLTLEDGVRGNEDNIKSLRNHKRDILDNNCYYKERNINIVAGLPEGYFGTVYIIGEEGDDVYYQLETYNSDDYTDYTYVDLTAKTNQTELIFEFSYPDSSARATIKAVVTEVVVQDGRYLKTTSLIDAGQISSGVLSTARIPSLDASKITSGVLSTARIPSLDASKITSGVLSTDRIPNLSAFKITSGTIPSIRLPLATSSLRGAVCPVDKTSDMTQPVGVDSNGRLFTKGQIGYDFAIYDFPARIKVYFTDGTTRKIESGITINLINVVSFSVNTYGLAPLDNLIVGDIFDGGTVSIYGNGNFTKIFGGGEYSYYSMPIPLQCHSFIGTSKDVPCLVAGTMISLSDGTLKAIESITYDDDLLVWDFDEGMLTSAKPVWIKRPEYTRTYYKCEYASGRVLLMAGPYGHRHFDVSCNLFRYGPYSVGHKVMAIDGVDECVSCERLKSNVEYYNVITHKHFNMFANGILTSNSMNNLYSFKDRKFVKDDRQILPYSEFASFATEKWYDGLRLGELGWGMGKLISYVKRMKNKEV